MIEILIFDDITVTPVITTETIVFSYNISEYRPKGYVGALTGYIVGGE